jgi:hypothetical protein
MTLTPAYGKDFKYAKDAVASWKKGDDWIIADITSPWDGKPCSIRDAASLGPVMLRFNKLTNITHP